MNAGCDSNHAWCQPGWRPRRRCCKIRSQMQRELQDPGAFRAEETGPTASLFCAYPGFPADPRGDLQFWEQKEKLLEGTEEQKET